MKYCPNCGSEVNEGDTFCTSCGGSLQQNNEPIQQNNSGDNIFGFEENHDTSEQTVSQQTQQQTQAQPQKTNTYCLVGLILSFLVAFVGLILSCMGLSQVKKNPEEKGKELAIAGIVISILNMIISFVIYFVRIMGILGNKLQ